MSSVMSERSLCLRNSANLNFKYSFKFAEKYARSTHKLQFSWLMTLPEFAFVVIGTCSECALRKDAATGCHWLLSASSSEAVQHWFSQVKYSELAKSVVRIYLYTRPAVSSLLFLTQCPLLSSTRTSLWQFLEHFLFLSEGCRWGNAKLDF